MTIKECEERIKLCELAEEDIISMGGRFLSDEEIDSVRLALHRSIAIEMMNIKHLKEVGHDDLQR